MQACRVARGPLFYTLLYEYARDVRGAFMDSPLLLGADPGWVLASDRAKKPAILGKCTGSPPPELTPRVSVDESPQNIPQFGGRPGHSGSDNQRLSARISENSEIHAIENARSNGLPLDDRCPKAKA